ncbi:Ureide permease [Actinidia chinensis var. chinensis]|uniref:Ureide permease n=1 Tax=Actinidia chinensis var. chinensis TaxID=1590841 RepID=A0A2R6RFQ2_ACTCC|nr:Ureide permease [Actinidia chinensis var. chinensis]
MYLVESKGGAIACMLFALFFLGTCPAILTLLERRGGLPQHTHLDYTITNLLAAVIIAFTFGEIGTSTAEEPNFLTQLSQGCRRFFVKSGASKRREERIWECQLSYRA